jgi:hypothetical protein
LFKATETIIVFLCFSVSWFPSSVSMPVNTVCTWTKENDMAVLALVALGLIGGLLARRIFGQTACSLPLEVTLGIADTVAGGLAINSLGSPQAFALVVAGLPDATTYAGFQMAHGAEGAFALGGSIGTAVRSLVTLAYRQIFFVRR